METIAIYVGLFFTGFCAGGLVFLEFIARPAMKGWEDSLAGWKEAIAMCDKMKAIIIELEQSIPVKSPLQIKK